MTQSTEAALREALEKIKALADVADRQGMPDADNVVIWASAGTTHRLTVADLRTIRQALSLAPQATADVWQSAIETAANVADMHDHKGDIGEAIRKLTPDLTAKSDQAPAAGVVEQMLLDFRIETIVADNEATNQLAKVYARRIAALSAPKGLQVYRSSSTDEGAIGLQYQDQDGLAGPSTAILGSAVSGAGFDPQHSCQFTTPPDKAAIAQPFYTDDEARRQIKNLEDAGMEWKQRAEAAEAKLKGAIAREGWRLVPVEPTQDMLDAGVLDHRHEQSWEGAAETWSAMLKAAPAPDAEAGQ